MEFNPGNTIIYIEPDTCKIASGIIISKHTDEYRDGRRIVKYKIESSDRYISSDACFCSVKDLIDFATSK